LSSGAVKVKGMAREIAKEDGPFTYWFHVGLYMILGIGSTLLGVYLTRHWADAGAGVGGHGKRSCMNDASVRSP
jgi:hypothetical protein